MKKYLFLLTITFLVSSCNKDDNSSKDIDELFKNKKESLQGELVNVDGDKIGKVFGLTLVDSLLILSSPSVNHVFQIIDLSNEQKIYTFGSKGSGPGEIGFPSFLQVNPDDKSELLIFDKNRFNIYSHKIKDILNPDILPQKIVSKTDVNIQRVVRIKNDFYLAYGIYQNRFALLNSQGKFLNGFVEYPSLEENENIEFSALAMAFQGKIKTDPDGRRAIMATTQSANFDIVDLEDDENPRHIFSLHSWKPEFINESGGNSIGVAFKQENKYGYIDLTTNEEFIYMLLSGRKRSDSRKDHRATKNVLVFDWLGNPIKQYTLDREVSSIEVNPEGTVLYAYVNVEPRLIIKYDLQ